MGEIRVKNTHNSREYNETDLVLVQQIWLCFLILFLYLYIHITCLIDTTSKKENNAYTNMKVITSTKESNHEIKLRHNKDLFPNILLLSIVVSVDVDYADLNAKLKKFDSAKRLCQNVAQLLFALDELHLDLTIFCELPD
jgi:hypothetical protein